MAFRLLVVLLVPIWVVATPLPSFSPAPSVSIAPTTLDAVKVSVLYDATASKNINNKRLQSLKTTMAESLEIETNQVKNLNVTTDLVDVGGITTGYLWHVACTVVGILSDLEQPNIFDWASFIENTLESNSFAVSYTSASGMSAFVVNGNVDVTAMKRNIPTPSPTISVAPTTPPPTTVDTVSADVTMSMIASTMLSSNRERTFKETIESTLGLGQLHGFTTSSSLASNRRRLFQTYYNWNASFTVTGSLAAAGVGDESGFQGFIVSNLGSTSDFAATLSAALGDTAVVVADVGAFGQPTPAPAPSPTLSPQPTTETWAPTPGPSPNPTRHPTSQPTLQPTANVYMYLSVTMKIQSNKDESPGRTATLETSVETGLAVSSSQVQDFEVTSKQPDVRVPSYTWKCTFLLWSRDAPSDVEAILVSESFQTQINSDQSGGTILAVTSSTVVNYVSPTPVPTQKPSNQVTTGPTVVPGLAGWAIALIVISGFLFVSGAAAVGFMKYRQSHRMKFAREAENAEMNPVVDMAAVY